VLGKNAFQDLDMLTPYLGCQKSKNFTGLFVRFVMIYSLPLLSVISLLSVFITVCSYAFFMQLHSAPEPRFNSHS